MKRRRARRRKKLLRHAALFAVAIAAGAGALIYWNLPGTKAGRGLAKATKYMTAMDYVHAEEAYTEVLSLDEMSIQAYRGLADDYAAQGRLAEAEETLLKGYKATGEEVLLQNYAAMVLNGVVDEINEGKTDFGTVGRCLDVLESAPGNADALELLNACARRLMVEEESSRMMLDDLDGSESFGQYAQSVERLLGLAEQNGIEECQEEYRQAAEAFIVPDVSEIYMSLSHGEAYRSILARAGLLGITEAEELLLCLDKQAQVSEYFAPVFTEFEAENYWAIRDVLTSDEYVSIRDAFIQNTMDYWYGDSYVPVTKEAIRFRRTQEGWKFSFVENDMLAAPTGTIRILAQTMKDLGVQRSSIEYVPPYERAQYYPHTEYEIVYWNTRVSGIVTDNTNVVSRMNYRFAEKVYTESGMEANVIYDWGGANEKRQKE